LKTKTLKVSNCARYDDFLEISDHLYERFCKQNKRKVFGVGVSMGGSILAHAIPKINYMTAAVTVCALVDYAKACANMRDNCYGFYDHHMGSYFFSTMQDTLAEDEDLRKQADESLGFDLVRKISDLKRQNGWTLSNLEE